MKILLTGSSGQAGQAIIKSKPGGVDLITPDRKELDLSNPQDCINVVQKYQPEWILNSAAYTSVDQSELNEGLAMSINANAPRAFAMALSKYGGRMLHISSDYVFNGKQSFPYKASQPRSPIGVYGRSKAAGEVAIEEILGGTYQAAILRTSWLMGPVGTNFALTMLELHKRNNPINVVSDQVGSPTSTLSLASACWAIIKNNHILQKSLVNDSCILHWTDAGVASWYDIAVAIGEIATTLELIDKPTKVISIEGKDFPSIARRPSYSVLNCSDTRRLISLPAFHWRERIKEILTKIDR